MEFRHNRKDIKGLLTCKTVAVLQPSYIGNLIYPFDILHSPDDYPAGFSGFIVIFILLSSNIIWLHL